MKGTFFFYPVVIIIISLLLCVDNYVYIAYTTAEQSRWYNIYKKTWTSLHIWSEIYYAVHESLMVNM